MGRTNALRGRLGFWILVLALSAPGLAHAGAGTWETGGPYGGNVLAFAIDPTNPATVYAGTHGVFKSTDSGIT